MKAEKNKPLERIVRRRTYSVNVGDVLVGGDAFISVQSMTNTLTPDIVSTLNQIETIKNAGYVDGIDNVSIVTTFDPPFSMEMVPEETKMILGWL